VCWKLATSRLLVWTAHRTGTSALVLRCVEVIHVSVSHEVIVVLLGRHCFAVSAGCLSAFGPTRCTPAAVLMHPGLDVCR
jgi:hypothetical protein